MRSGHLLAMVATLGMLGGACGSDSMNPAGPAGTHGSGSGGTAPQGSGGSVGSGGSATTTGTGGKDSTSSGGQTVSGSGGSTAGQSGGASGGGGEGTGGEKGTGGSGTAGAPGTSGTGGRSGLAGHSGEAGTPGSGGSMGPGGSGPIAGRSGTGGTSGTGGAGGSTSMPPPGNPAVKSMGCGMAQGKQMLTSGAQAVAGVSTAYRINITSGTTEREYIIDIPANYDNTHPYRLVFAYHWVGANDTIIGTGSGYCDSHSTSLPAQYYGMKAVDTAGTTIFVAPKGISGNWGNSNQQDVKYTDDVLAQIESNLCIDTTRIFAFGFSYGGSMSYTIACARPTVFRGVSIWDGGSISSPPSPCNMPIAFMQVHGVGDNTFPISGATKLRDNFVKNNGCMATTIMSVGSGSHTHLCGSYMGCSAGHPLEWCTFDGGHQACEYDGGSGDSVAKSWVPAETWKFFTQF